MGNKINIKSSLSPAKEAFKNFTGEQIVIRMDKDQIATFILMVTECEGLISEDDSELEIIVLKEIKQMLFKKYHIISNRANVSFSCSQARTIFYWLNDNYFTHPLQESFSCWVVDQIYRQII